ncbi:hypothetical protein ALT785_380047 [Alteromonas infernus]
MAYEDVNNT